MGAIAIHPGEHIQEELDALQLDAEAMAERLDVPTVEFLAIVHGQQALTADVAMRLAHFFGTSAQFWLGLQDLYDLRLAEQRNGQAIKKLPTLKQLQAA